MGCVCQRLLFRLLRRGISLGAGEYTTSRHRRDHAIKNAILCPVSLWQVKDLHDIALLVDNPKVTVLGVECNRGWTLEQGFS